MKNQSLYTGWYSSSKTSYHDYIQAKEFEKSIRYGLDSQTKQIIANDQQLARENYEILNNIGEQVSEGFTLISKNLDSLHGLIDREFKELGSTFEWGFSEVLTSLGHVNDSLNNLIKIAKTPAQTWAYEQFEIARDEFRRGLYLEALESLNKAINGFGSNSGYKTEFRFHFFNGTIRLGSYKNNDPTVVDIAKAEESFLNAARYSKNDFPSESARSLLCAGRAAFIQLDLALRRFKWI